MAKKEQNISSYFTTNRTFDKWVISKNRKLEIVKGGEIPFEHSPSTGKRIGMLMEGRSTNLFRDSENLIQGIIKSNSISVSKGIATLLATDVGYIGTNEVSITDDYIAISFYIKSSRFPVFGYKEDKNATFCVQLNKTDANVAAANVSIEGPLSTGEYRVRLRLMNTKKTITDVRIVKSDNHSNRLDISKIQIEKNQWSSYIPTTGSAKTRNKEVISRSLRDGVDINQNQGTIRLDYRPTPGTGGSVATLTSESEEINVGKYFQKNNELKFIDMPSNVFPLYASIDRRFDWDSDSTSIVSYSGYGIRVYNSLTNKVDKLKNYKFRNKITKITFGSDEFFGVIKQFKWKASATNDKDMKALSEM